MRLAPAVIAVFASTLVASCGDDPVTSSGAQDDLASATAVDLRPSLAEDLAVDKDAAADLADPADLATTLDLAVARSDLAGQMRCGADSDCRLYSSPCKNPMPCLCLALRNNEPNPTCIGPMVLCDPDPCDGKAVRCDQQTGQCVAR